MNLKPILWIVGGIAVIALLVGGTMAWRYYSAPVRGTIDAQERIESGSSRVYNYEWFYDSCARVQGYEDTLNTQFSLLDNVEGQNEREMILTNISGIQAQRAKSIRNYNSRSRQYYVGRFKDEGLPERLEGGQYEQGDPVTSCE